MSLYMTTLNFAIAAMSMMFYTWKINYKFLKVNKSNFFRKFMISQQMIISIKIVSSNLLNDFIIDFVWKTLSENTFAITIFVKEIKHRATKTTIFNFIVYFETTLTKHHYEFYYRFFLMKKYNVICIIIDRLIKKRHYIFLCWSDEQDFNAKKVIFIIIWNVFCFHKLFDTIVFDKNSQFISMIWKHMCVRLRIKINMSIVFYFFTNE